MFWDGAFNRKRGWLNLFCYSLSWRNWNCITGSRVTAILLNWWILPIGGVALVRIYNQQGRARQTFENNVEEDKIKWHMTHDLWQVTGDMWHVTCDKLGEVVLLLKFQLPSSYVLKIFPQKMTDWVNELISNGGVWRTAPPTLGQLIILIARCQIRYA